MEVAIIIVGLAILSLNISYWIWCSRNNKFDEVFYKIMKLGESVDDLRANLHAVDNTSEINELRKELKQNIDELNKLKFRVK